MRPVLTPEQAQCFRRDEVLRYTGKAGADRLDPWFPRIGAAKSLVPDFVVGPASDFPTIQAALNHIADLRHPHGRLVIGVKPGRYEGLVYVPRGVGALTIIGLGADREDVLIHENIDAEMTGREYRTRFSSQFAHAPKAVREIFERIGARGFITTANASVMRVEADDLELINLSFRNTYNCDRDQDGSSDRNAFGQYAKGQHQAVALLSAGADRLLVKSVRLRSFQDTLYLQSPNKGWTVRSCLIDCDIEGDVDFIFGQSTAWFEGCTIRSLGSRAPQSWVTAPSTDIRTRYGFVFDTCEFCHDGSERAHNARMGLGRQWFEGVRATPYPGSTIEGYRCDLGPLSSYDPPRGKISKSTLESVGKCIIQNSRIGRHINMEQPWDHWGGNSWHPRYRPAQYKARDMFQHLGPWLKEQGLSYQDIDPDMIFLAEYNNVASDF